MDLTPTRFWLMSASYLEEKRAVSLLFSRLDNRRMVRQPFFPCFYASKSLLSFEQLKQALSGEKKRFKILPEKQAFKVSAPTFSDLNCLANALFEETGFRPLVLPPERQFLLDRQWSYFDSFFFFSEKEFVKEARFSVPKARLEFFSEPLHETLRQLLKESQEIAGKTIESVALSNLLTLPVEQLSGGFHQQETIFENIFWKAGLGMKQRSFHLEANAMPPKPAKAGRLAEVDFSMLWPTLLTKPIYNLANDTIDCKCCQPRNAFEKNVLPSTLVLVEMLQDGFFFESGSRSFASWFHGKHGSKESRLRRMQEYCLKSIPVGPFFRFEKPAVPLIDAVKLQKSGKAKIIGLKRLHWFCLKRESLLSKAVSSFNEEISLLEGKCGEMQLTALKEHGVLGNNALASNALFLFQRAFLSAYSRLLCGMPTHLCLENSAFFSRPLCSAVEAIESEVLENFRQFAKKRKSRVVGFGQGKAFVSTDKPFALVKQFSEKQMIPALLKARSR